MTEKELWGTFSVKDNMRNALSSLLLLYDRLVIQVPAKGPLPGLSNMPQCPFLLFSES